jgi:hypothetical protein
MEHDSLQPQLDLAQRTLEQALSDACSFDIRDVDTGELIKIEESLATATKAAKDAVSVRLKLRARRKRQAVSVITDAGAGITQRIFDDIRGKRWRVYPVTPSHPAPERVALPAPFREGWLVFESVDETRRVAPIPVGWEELTIDQLRLLCFKAPSTPRRLTADRSKFFKGDP